MYWLKCVFREVKCAFYWVKVFLGLLLGDGFFIKLLQKIVYVFSSQDTCV